jgi:hypothetical protein
VFRNLEVSVYGLTLAGSGISEFIANQLSEDPSVLVEYAGLGFLLLGFLVFLLGLFWKRDPLGKPLGVLLLSAGLSVVGVLTIFLGGWFFTPLFLLAFVCFGIVYGLISGRSWALYGLLVFVMVVFIVSLAGIGNGGVVNVAGVLSSCYLFWYLGRKHVAEYFKIESIVPTLSRRSLAALLVVIILILVLIGFLHLYPSSSMVESAGAAGSGTGSRSFTFHKNDWINYSFQSQSGYSPVQVSIRSGAEWGSGDLIALESASSGSLTATIPFSGTYTVYYESIGGGYYNLDYDLTVTFYSWRSVTPLWALLGFYGVTAVSAAILKRARAKIVCQEPNLRKETENAVDQ